MDHLVESEPVLAREREHHVRLEPREDAALLDHPPELVREAVTAHPVVAVLLDVRAQQLHAQDRGLAPSPSTRISATAPISRSTFSSTRAFRLWLPRSFLFANACSTGSLIRSQACWITRL